MRKAAIERVDPDFGSGSGAVGRQRMEGLFEQLRNRRADGRHGRRKGRRRHLRARRIAAVGIPALGDRALDRHVPATEEASGERMAADEARKAGPVANLEAVTVNGGDGGGLMHENVRVVDVTANEPGLVDGCKEARDIGRRVDQEAEIG
jgi:hypothetical protein